MRFEIGIQTLNLTEEVVTQNTEHRKNVWRAVRQSAHAINVTDQAVCIDRQGLIVYEDRRGLYDDGRNPAEEIRMVGQRRIIFIPYVPQPDEDRIRITAIPTLSSLRVGAN